MFFTPTCYICSPSPSHVHTNMRAWLYDFPWHRLHVQDKGEDDKNFVS